MTGASDSLNRSSSARRPTEPSLGAIGPSFDSRIWNAGGSPATTGAASTLPARTDGPRDLAPSEMVDMKVTRARVRARSHVVHARESSQGHS